MSDPYHFGANLPNKFVAPTQPAAAEPEQRTSTSRARGISNASSRIQKAFEESDPPHGFYAATASVASSIAAGATIPIEAHPPNIAHDQRIVTNSPDASNIPHTGPSMLLPIESAADDGTTLAPTTDGSPRSAGSGAAPATNSINKEGLPAIAPNKSAEYPLQGEDADLYRPYENGYHFPPKYTFKDTARHAAVGLWQFTITPVGFLVVLYALNVVAWGAMIFFLLLNAAPAMCYPTCDDINSPRRIWVEYTAQILTALFSVTGFGLAPWRFRDMFWLLKFRLGGDYKALRRLAGIHRGWLRLAGSQNIPVEIGPDNIPADLDRAVIPFPEEKMSDPPLTGHRAPPTKLWKLDFILWNNVMNTFVQGALSGIMWGQNRYTRESWATGFLVALACIVGAIGGLGEFFEGKSVKGIEGVPLTDEDKEKLEKDLAQGIYHYNNIKGKKPKEKKKKRKANDVEAAEKA